MSSPFDNKYQIEEMLANELNAYTAELYDDGHRKHLGASMIGEECHRKLWYVFRWVKTPDYVDARGVSQKGRMQRLFNRGHKEEFRIVEWLRGLGFVVDEFDPASRLYYNPPTDSYSLEQSYDQPDAIWDDVSGTHHEEIAAGRGVKRKQLRILDCHGHFGGSTDGVITFPPRYKIDEKLLAEFKTHNAKSFAKLVAEKVRKAKPTHYSQMCVYGHKLGLKRALYIAVNKDTDEIYYEIVELDLVEAEHLLRVAEKVITNTKPPARKWENPSYYMCKFCDFASVCHGQAKYEVNCRSCAHAQAAENRQWYCNLYQQIIPEEFIAKGCPSHTEAR